MKQRMRAWVEWTDWHEKEKGRLCPHIPVSSINNTLPRRFTHLKETNTQQEYIHTYTHTLLSKSLLFLSTIGVLNQPSYPSAL